MQSRRRTCPGCFADITTDEGVWRCDWGGRHCTRCYEPFDERTCPMVHDPIGHAADDAEAARVHALRRAPDPAPRPTRVGGSPRRRTAAAVNVDNVPPAVLWLAKKLAKRHAA